MPVVDVEALIQRTLQLAQRGVDDAAQFLASEVQGSAPVASGDLRAGIHAEPAAIAGDTVQAIVATSSETDDYSVVQEVGYWVNFRGRYGYVAIKGGAPHYFQANAEAFGPFLVQYVSAAVGGGLA